jgi:hypothetical protein
VELFDPTLHTWSLQASMSEPRRGHGAALLPDGERVFVTGGVIGVGQRLFGETFDPAAGQAGQWTSSSVLPGPMAQFENGTTTLLPNGSVMLAGSYHWPATVRYAPSSGTWGPIENMSKARSQHTATLLADGTLLAAGGLDEGGTAEWQADLYELDATGTPCARSFDCISGFCVAGMCCNEACGDGVDPCRTCTKAAGATADGSCTTRAVPECALDGGGGSASVHVATPEPPSPASYFVCSARPAGRCPPRVVPLLLALLCVAARDAGADVLRLPTA